MYYYSEIAGLIIKIENNNKTAESLIEALQGKPIEPKENFDILIKFPQNFKKKYIATVFSAKGSMNFNKNEYFVDYITEISYLIRNLFNKQSTVIEVNVEKSSIKKKINSLLSGKINVNKNTILSYSLFWYVLHLELLKKGKAFIHAGIFDINENATIITGTGGCGKTSTLFKFLELKKVRYLSEDFGIIDKKGNTFYNPKPVSIYASDMEFGQNVLKNYFNKFSKKMQFTWFLKRNLLKLNPMIKVNPNLLMGEKICLKSKVKNVVYCVRNNDTQISINDISLDELAERILDASMRELKTLNELLLLIRANAPMDHNVLSFEDIRRRTKEIYLNSFVNTKNKIVYIPHKTKPDDLVNFLQDNLKLY